MMWLWPPDSWRSLLRCCRKRLTSGELPFGVWSKLWRLCASGSPEHCGWPLYRSQKDETPQNEEVPSSCHVPLVPSTDKKRFQGSDLSKQSTKHNKGGSRADKQYIDSWTPALNKTEVAFSLQSQEFCYLWPGWRFFSRKSPWSPICFQSAPPLSLGWCSSWSMTVAQAQTITNTVWRWKAWKRKRQRMREKVPRRCHLFSSHWLKVSHMTTDSYMGFWEILLLEGPELNIRGCVI